MLINLVLELGNGIRSTVTSWSRLLRKKKEKEDTPQRLQEQKLEHKSWETGIEEATVPLKNWTIKKEKV